MNTYLKIIVLPTVLSSCATMEESLKLGGTIGAATGAVATYAGHAAAGKSPTLEAAAIGTGIGTVLGLATAYLTHKKLAEDRKNTETQDFEMYFGDLPPSPFIFPKTLPKKGTRQ